MKMYDIQKEIDLAKSTVIINDTELQVFREKYLTKDGVLPRIYSEIGNMRGSMSSFFLNKMIELRYVVDDKIREYKKKNN